MTDNRKMERVSKGLYKRWSTDGKSFTWVAVYADHGGKMVRRTLKDCRKRRDAEDELHRLKVEVHEIKEKGYQPRLDPELTIGQLIDDYLDFARDHLKQGDRLTTTAKALLSFFGEDRKAISVSKSDVEAFIKWRKEQPKERGQDRDPKTGEIIGEPVKVRPATINRELALLKTAFNRAIQNEVLERNPVALVKMLKENNVRDRVLTDAEYKALLNACTEPYLKLIVVTAYQTGMRRGEIENLQWDRVDLDGGFINLKPEDTKSGEGRRIPLPGPLLDAFKALRREQAGQSTAIEALPFVFRRSDREGGIFIRAGATKRSFTRACKDADLDDFHFHDLRHTFVTRMRDQGVPDRTIMAITGHKTMSVFMRYDSGPGEDQLRAAVSGYFTQTLSKV